MSDNFDDLLGDIDSLIAENLEQGERGEAFQENPDPCGHCQQMWHGLPITRRMVEMREEYQSRMEDLYEAGEEVDYAHWVMPDDYSYADDDSHVFCPGSDVEGPNPQDAIWDRRHRVAYYGNQARHRQKRLKKFRLHPGDWEPWEIVIESHAEMADSMFRRSGPFVLNTINEVTLRFNGRWRQQDLERMGITRYHLENDWTCYWEGTNGTFWSAPPVKFRYEEVEYEVPEGKTEPDFLDITSGHRDLLRYNSWLQAFIQELPASPCPYNATDYEKLWTNKGLQEKG